MKLQNLRQADELVDLAMEALANEIPAEHLSEEKVRKAVLQLLEAPDNLYHTIEMVNDKIVGFMVGVLHEGAFDNRTYATEISGYVKPEHRGRVIADKMREDFESWAKSKAADVVNIITFTALARPLQARGYASSQSVFYKEVA